MPIVYRITNKVNGKTYIGKSTKTLEERLTRHFYNHRTSNTYLYKAMRKYGIENFSGEVLEETTLENLDAQERSWIAMHNPEYNMTTGGEGGDTSKSPNYISGMAKRDMSGSKNPMYGRKRPDNAAILKSARHLMIKANSCPVICEGKEFASVGAAQAAYPGISISKRLNSPKYPEFYRLRERTRRK